jgi:hypothetical protein
MTDSCCSKEYNCKNGCSPDEWYEDPNMKCNIASKTITPSWPKNPRVCGADGSVYYPMCSLSKIWAQSRENLSCEEIVPDNGGHIAYIESNGFKWNPEHSRCEPVDVRDKITDGVYSNLLDCLKENNNHNGICTDAISNCDSCNGNMYKTCFCAPIIKAPIYYNNKFTGETMNLPIITNQVKNDILTLGNQINNTDILDKMTEFTLSFTIPIGLWINFNNSYKHKGILDTSDAVFRNYGQYEYPSFYKDMVLSGDEIDCKLDIGYYKNINIDTMTLTKTEFSLIIKLNNNILNIYLNDNNKPIIQINMLKNTRWLRSPDYTILNAAYNLDTTYGTNKPLLQIILALPNKTFSSILSSYHPTKPVTSINRRNIENKINKKVKSVRDSENKGMFTTDGYSYILLDPKNYPDII